MVWHGTSKTQAARVFLTDDQWLMLAELAEDSEYWEAAQGFMKGIDGRVLSSISVKQLDWYESICAALDVEINKRKARITFGLQIEDD